MNRLFRKYGSILLILILLTISLTSCKNADTQESEAPAVEPGEAEVPEEEPTPQPEPTEIPPTETSEPTAEPIATEVPFDPQPAEPQEITFQASDGQELNGLYFPAAVDSAPLIVLHHWAPGDQYNWPAMAFWLQNRGLTEADYEFTPALTGPWLDSSWFPEIPAESSYAVFTFTYRSCEGGCSSYEPEGWLLDAQAAMQTAYMLEGVDQSRIIAAGASIGADGAPDSCLWLNEQYPGSCQGAFSFSPGSYLNLDYAQVVSDLEALEPALPVWCLYSDGDTTSAETCQAASGELYQAYGYTGSGHGLDLVGADIEPNALELLLDFIDQTIGS